MKRDNLFLVAYNSIAGKYGPEDLLTDQFGALLAIDKRLSTSWFEKITGIAPDELIITTQPPFHDYPHDAPDMLLQSDRLVLICEHKLSSPLGKTQLKRYLDLVHSEQIRTGIPHRLAVVGKNRLNVPVTILKDDNYCHPSVNERHFFWKDVYNTLSKLQDLDGETQVTRTLRKQFMEYLRDLGLAPITLPKGFVPYKRHNTPAEKEQQSAFGEAWAPTRNWLEDKGYRTNPSSRSGLYIYTTPYSEIPNHKGMHHILLDPTEELKMPGMVDIELPVIEYDFTLDPGYESLANKIIAGFGSHLKYLNLTLAAGRRKTVRGLPRFALAVSLKPLFETGDLSRALFEVTKEIYMGLLPAFTK